MTSRARDGSFTHTHGVMHLFPTGVKKVHGGMAWSLRKPCLLLPMYQRCRLLLDSRVVIGHFLRNRLFLQAFHEGRDRWSIFGKSRLISSPYRPVHDV